MYNTVVAVAASVVLGGGALYAGYQAVEPRLGGEAPAEPTLRQDTAPARTDPGDVADGSERSSGGLRGAYDPLPDETQEGSAADPAPSQAAMTANPALIDKPDGAFTANRRLTDKPDTAPYFTQNTKTDRFDPCTKADGTAYRGPGTATDPFAKGDPCLPQAVAGSYEVAAMAPGLATASDAGGTVAAGTATLPPPPPPPPIGTSFRSDYRT